MLASSLIRLFVGVVSGACLYDDLRGVVRNDERPSGRCLIVGDVIALPRVVSRFISPVISRFIPGD